jgi:hypothetical protein
MRKQIDLPDDLLRDLKLLAMSVDKSVKKFMEDLIINHIKENIRKIKR